MISKEKLIKICEKKLFTFCGAIDVNVYMQLTTLITRQEGFRTCLGQEYAKHSTLWRTTASISPV